VVEGSRGAVMAEHGRGTTNTYRIHRLSAVDERIRRSGPLGVAAHQQEHSQAQEANVRMDKHPRGIISLFVFSCKPTPISFFMKESGLILNLGIVPS
jgi:hypothetical protein